MTGQLEEEKMQVYVRLGIRLLYKVSNNTFITTLSAAAPCHRIETFVFRLAGRSFEVGGCARYVHGTTV